MSNSAIAVNVNGSFGFSPNSKLVINRVSAPATTTPITMPMVANNVLIAAAILSISLNPLYYRLIDRVDAWAERRPKLWALE